jgi:hypothetical protein
MRMSAPSLVRRAHNNRHSPPPPSCASTRDDHHYHHRSNHHDGDLPNASAATIARRSFFSCWNHLFFTQSKKKWTTLTGCLTLCIVFLMLNLISMGSISASSSFRRAHSSSTNFFSSYSYYTSQSNENSLRYHIEMPHSILFFSSTAHPRSISQASSSSSSLVLPTRRLQQKAANFGLLEIEMLPKDTTSSRFRRSIRNETDEDGNMDDDMEDRIAVYMTGWDDSSDAQSVPVFRSDKKNQSNAGSKKDAQPQQKDCQRVSWHKTVYPNCNTFHELDLAMVSTVLCYFRVQLPLKLA